MEWYDRKDGVTYRIFTRFHYPLVVITQQEEEDLKAMCKVKDKIFTITNDKDEIAPVVEKMMDSMEEVYHKLTGEAKKLTFFGTFLVMPFILFCLLIFACYASMFVYRVGYKKKLFYDEISPLYKETVKAINNRYERRIEKLAGLKNEKNGRK